MLTIGEYVKPASIEEAYELLVSSENAAIVGGGFFMRLSSKKIGTAIDLSKAGLDYINDTADTVEIGAMTTFSQLEKSAVLQKKLDGIIPASVEHLPGTQMKNMVTVGGTVSGKFGFSELMTGLLTLDCSIVLHHGGTMNLKEFMAMKGKLRDIVVKVIVKKEPIRGAYKMFRNSSGSLPILAVAVSRNEQDYRIAIGGRPAVAALAKEAMAFLTENAVNAENIAQAAEIAATELEFSGDRRASGEYRRELCKVLVKRAVTEVQP